MNTGGPDLHLANVLLATLPIAVLFITILSPLKWSASKAGALAWLVAAVIAFTFFGSGVHILGVASSKGLSLSLFVLTIIWSSVLLYNMIDRLGGIDVIGTTMTRFVKDPLAQALIVGWAFSGFMQGIAGFGVPVAVVAPLLVLMKFSPAKAAAIVLVGHSWAVTFGSLGSSYYTIQLVTSIDGRIIGPHMALMFALPTITTGFAVAYMEGGLKSIRRGGGLILLMGLSISVGLWSTVALGVPQIASIVAGLLGCGIGWLLTKIFLLRTTTNLENISHNNIDSDKNNQNGRQKDNNIQDLSQPSIRRLGFHLAFLPYYLLLALSVISQLPEIKNFGATWQWGLNYPTTETTLGHVAEAKNHYAAIRFLGHPAPLILFSLVFSYLVFRVSGKWGNRSAWGAVKITYKQVVPSSVGILTMVMMALVMTDTGMTVLLGRAIAIGTGQIFPLFAPYIGVLGTFMTGSNTNSNVMFGALQLETARALGIGSVTLASAQSIGGALGSAIAPAKVLVGTAVVGLSGRENEVLRRTIPYCLAIVALVGIEAWILIYVFQ